ncbi:hypothetical protein PM082_020110 [Marasmius tenuissimus]|nr:hypothetical protein PM082_020110 [Marasmius tenuissimus]
MRKCTGVPSFSSVQLSHEAYKWRFRPFGRWLVDQPWVLEVNRKRNRALSRSDRMKEGDIDVRAKKKLGSHICVNVESRTFVA